MNVKLSKIYYWILIILVLLSYNFFYLLPLPGAIAWWCRMDNFSVLLSIAGLSSCCLIMRKKRSGISGCYKWFEKYSQYLVVAFLLQLVFSLIKYNRQSFFFAYRVGAPLLVVLLTPMFLYIFEFRGTTLLDTLDNLCFLWNAIIIVQSAVYASSGRFLFDFQSYYSGRMFEVRTYGARIGMGQFGPVFILYNLSNLFSRKEMTRKRKYFTVLKLIVGILSLLFVAQVRALTICIAISFLIQVLKSGRTQKAKIWTVIVVLLVVIPMLFVFNDKIISYFFAAGMGGGLNSNSSMNRVYAMDYYWNCFLKSPFLGNGFVDGSVNSAYYAVEHGPQNVAWYSDVGFMGLLAKTGLIAILYYIIPVTKMCKVAHRVYKYVSHAEGGFLISCVVYVLLTSLTLIITDSGRVFLYPCLLALLLYYERIYIRK